MRVIGVLLVAFALLSCATSHPESARAESDHFRDGRYFAPWQEFRINWAALWDYLASPNPYKGQDFGAVPQVTNARLPDTDMPTVTWIGHATFAIQDGGDLVLTDPHLGTRALLISRSTPPALDISAVQQARFGVISHNHYDHLDEQTVKALPADMLWVVPAGLGPWFQKQGRRNVVELDWWQSTTSGDWTITCVPVQHWSRRWGQPTNSTLWCGWVMQSAQTTYFFAGDTGYFDGFAEIGRRFPELDVALLPIGAWQPQSFLRYQHMGPAEALQAFDDLGAKNMIPMHWGSFKLSQEPLNEPPTTLRALIAGNSDRERRVRILAMGESWSLNSSGHRSPHATSGVTSNVDLIP